MPKTSRPPPGPKTVPPKPSALPRPPIKPALRPTALPSTGPHTLASIKPLKPPVSSQPASSTPMTVKPVPAKSFTLCVPRSTDTISCRLNMQQGGKVLRLEVGATQRLEPNKGDPISIKVIEVRYVAVEGVEMKMVKIEHSGKAGFSVATSLLF